MRLNRVKTTCAIGVALLVSVLLTSVLFAHDYSAPFFYMAGVYSDGVPNYPPASDEEMAWLLKQIQDDDKDVRTIAAGALGQTLDKRAADPLLKAITDRAAFVRMNATMSFVHIQDPRSVKPLTAMLEDQESGYGSYAAMYALARQGDAGIKALISMMPKLKNGRQQPGGDAEQSAMQLAEAIAVGMGSDVIDWAVGHLKSTDPQIRSVALHILRNISESEEGRKAIEKSLKGSEPSDDIKAILYPQEKKAAATSPTKLTDKDIARLVSDIKRYGRNNDMEYNYENSPAYKAALILANSGNPKAINALMSMLSGKSSYISEYLLYPLVSSANPSAIQALLRLAKNDTNIAWALMAARRPGLAPFYITMLKSKDEHTVCQAIDALADARSREAIKSLIPMLAKTRYQDEVIHALAAIGDPKAIDALIPLLNKKNTQSKVGEALVRFGSDAVTKVIPKLKDSDPMVRIIAVGVLARIPDARSVDPLIAAMSDKYAGVRGCVLSALIAQNDPKIKKAIISALRDKSVVVRKVAAIVIADAPEAPDAESAKAMEALINDKDKELQACAAVVMGQMGDQGVADKIIRILTPDPEGYTEFSSLILPAMRAAGVLKDKRAVKPILRTLGGDVSMSVFDGMTAEQNARSRKIKLDALRSITGKDFGEGYYRWMAYWVAQGNRMSILGEQDTGLEDASDNPDIESDNLF